MQAQSWFQDLTPITRRRREHEGRHDSMAPPVDIPCCARILYAIPIAFGVSVVCFSLVYLAPGDPLQTVLPPDATAETIAIVKHAYGFDKPLPVQFVIWLGHVLTGDFGMSIATRRPVILRSHRLRCRNTLDAGGVRGADRVLHRLRDGRPRRLLPGTLDRPGRDRRRGGRRQPAELLARHRAGDRVRGRAWLAAGDRHGTATALPSSASSRWSDAQFLVLPVITLSMIPVGIIARTTRAAVAEVLNQDFVTTLRAKGLVGIGRDPPRAEERRCRRCWR